MKKNNKYKIFIGILFMAMIIINHAHSQVVISLLFGKKLNSENVQFGLDGGLNYSNLTNASPANDHRGFNLGLYFDFRVKQNSNWFLHTGLVLKSPMGADGLKVYSLANPELDSTYNNGEVNRQLKYINLPLLFRYKFNMHLYAEAGAMMGIMVKATDVFYESVQEDKDQSYKNNIYDKCNHFDVGGMAGIGYHFMKGNGMNMGLRYYVGFTNILNDNNLGEQKNNSLYLYLSIPIGAGEKAKAKENEKTK